MDINKDDPILIEQFRQGEFHVDQSRVVDNRYQCGYVGANSFIWAVSIKGEVECLGHEGFMVDNEILSRTMSNLYRHAPVLPSCERMAHQALMAVLKLCPVDVKEVVATVGISGGSNISARWQRTG